MIESLERIAHHTRRRCKIPLDMVIDYTKILFDNTVFIFDNKIIIASFYFVVGIIIYVGFSKKYAS